MTRFDPELFGARTPPRAGCAPDDAALLERWRTHRIQVDGVEADTAQGCVEAAERFLAECPGLTTIGAPVIAQWIKSRTFSRKRCASVMSMLRSLGDYLVLIEAREDNPWRQFRMARVRKSRGYDAFTTEQAAALFAVCDRQAQAADGRCAVHGVRRGTFYRFLWLTGLRWNEARRQLWSDVDLVAGRMTVTADKARRLDSIPLSAEAVALLREWRGFLDARTKGAERASPRVFHRAIGRKSAVRDLRDAGLPRGKGLFHRWRVGFVTRLLDSGVELANVAHLARHETITQTLGYDRVKESRLRRALEQNASADKMNIADVSPTESVDCPPLVKDAYDLHKKSVMKTVENRARRDDISPRHVGSPLLTSKEHREAPSRPASELPQRRDTLGRDGASPCSGDGAERVESLAVNGPGGIWPAELTNAVADLARTARLLAEVLAERSATDGKGRARRAKDGQRASARQYRSGRDRTP